MLQDFWKFKYFKEQNYLAFSLKKVSTVQSKPLVLIQNDYVRYCLYCTVYNDPKEKAFA